jgi:hypothetical protein
MAIEVYDLAMKEKISAIYGNVAMGPINYLFEEASRNDSGKLTFPLIGITRYSWQVDKENFNVPALLSGKYSGKGPDGKYYSYPVMPIMIPYQIDVLSDKRGETDGLSEELVWFFTYHPNLKFKVTQPYEWNCLDASLALQDVNDTSDLESFYDKGRIWRVTIDLMLTHAQLIHFEKYSPAIDIPITIELI